MLQRSVFLTERQHVALAEEASRLGITVADLIRRAVDALLDGKRKGPRAA